MTDVATREIIERVAARMGVSPADLAKGPAIEREIGRVVRRTVTYSLEIAVMLQVMPIAETLREVTSLLASLQSLDLDHRTPYLADIATLQRCRRMLCILNRAARELESPA